ncbi:MAG: hypothetical protein Q9162_006062 [Coniocarpon cinnabarinum]
MDDPWDWSVDDVVAHLCYSPNHLWADRGSSSALPNVAKLEEALRENDINGSCLLTDVDLNTLKADLGIQALGQRSKIFRAINELRGRSPRWKSQQAQDESRKRQISDLASVASPVPSVALTPDPGPARVQDVPRSQASLPHTPQPTSGIAHQGESSTANDEVVAKKRRINVQTMVQPPQSNFAYLGRKPLIASAILTSQSTSHNRHYDDESDSEDFTHIAESETPALGSALFVRRRIHGMLRAEPELNNSKQMQLNLCPARLCKGPVPSISVQMTESRESCTINRENKLSGAESDETSGNEWAFVLENNPVQTDEDALPLYGDSEDEEDAQSLMEEIEQDHREAEPDSKYLSLEQVRSAIDERIFSFKEDWKTRSLPMLEYRAHAYWLNRGASRHLSAQSAVNGIQRKQRILDSHMDGIINDRWTKVENLRSQCNSLELDVKRVCELEWKVQLWNQIRPPPKPNTTPAMPIRRQKVSDDDSIDLASESEGLENFVEDDERPLAQRATKFYGTRNDMQQSPLSQNGSLGMKDIDSVFGNDTERETPVAAAEPAQNDVPMIDLTQELSSPPRGPEQVELDNNDIQTLSLSPPTTPQKPAPEPSVLASSWFTEPLDATREEILSWDMDTIVERTDRKRLLLKLLLDLDLTSFSILKRRFESLDQGPANAFKFETRRALGELTSQTGSLTGLSEDGYLGATLLAKLFVCWVDPDPAHFLDDVIDVSAITKARKVVQENILWYRTFLSGALGEEGAAARESDLEDSEQTPRKRRRKKASARTGQKLRDDAWQRREQDHAAVQKLKLHSSDLKEESADGHIINPAADENDFIYIRKSLSDVLLEHQIDGVRFLWREVITGAADEPSGSGCLLAHTMGLGKTMQTITFLLTVIDTLANSRLSSQIPPKLRPREDKFPRFMVLCPPTLIQNWRDEFWKWLPQEHTLKHHVLIVDSTVDLSKRCFYVNLWYDNGGVLILGYEMFRDILNGKISKTEKQREAMQAKVERATQQLCSPVLVIADEAHKFKDPTRGIGLAMAKLETLSRIALTGSPLANNLSEYFAMINWVAPKYLGSLIEFRETFQTPIEDGMYADSTRYEQRKSYKKLEALKSEVEPKVNRKDISSIRKDIPQKSEFVLRFKLTKLQFDLYTRFVRALKGREDLVSNTRLFEYINTLTLLLYHPYVFLQKLRQRDDQKKSAKPSSADDVPQDVDVNTSNLDLTSSMLDEMQEYFKDLPEEYPLDTRLSPKTWFIQQIIQSARSAGEMVLIFTHSRPVLDHLQRWVQELGIKMCRLDGQTAMPDRLKMAKEFNGGKYEVMIVSTRAGGLGLNLPGANRVILADFSFNPSWEEQAVGRAYRLGQKKPVFVYHLLYSSTFEEPLHQRTVFKKQLSDRAVDKKKSKPMATKITEFLFEPEPDQDELVENDKLYEEYKGQDRGLDAVLNSEQRSSIQKITPTDIFNQNEDELSPEEKLEVKKEIEMWRAKGTDPAKYEQMRRAQEAKELARQRRYLANPAEAAASENSPVKSGAAMPEVMDTTDTQLEEIFTAAMEAVQSGAGQAEMASAEGAGGGEQGGDEESIEHSPPPMKQA